MGPREKNADWDMMLETGRTGAIKERRQRMRTVFKDRLATNELIKRQCDEDHDERCTCGEVESQEHVMCSCSQKEVWNGRKKIVTEVHEVVFGEDGNKKSVGSRQWRRQHGYCE